MTTKRVFEFLVLDPPTPMGRKRWSGKGKSGGHFYTESKDTRSVYHIRQAFMEHYPDEEMIGRGVPVKLSVRFWYKAPGNMSGKKRKAAWMKPIVATRPDVPNILAQVCDALTGYAYYDDGQISWSEQMEFYAVDRDGKDTPQRMSITVEELE